MKKTILTSQQLLEESFRLGASVLSSGFKPTLIIAIWRGGAPVGVAVQELLAYCGVNADHIAIRTSSYSGTRQRATVNVHGLNYVVEHSSSHDRLLIVDDVFDTGKTLAAVIASLREKTGDQMPQEVRIATPWFKPTRNQTDLVPDYYNHATEEWLVFPHELDSLSAQELISHRPEVAQIIAQAKAALR